MNKTYKYTLTAHEKKEISFDTGVARLAIANGDGVDGSTTVIMSEITKQHSGDIVSFLDGADAPFADFKVNIETVQSGSGDPSPTNVRPISGFNAVNVGDISDTEKVTYFKGLLDGTYGFVVLDGTQSFSNKTGDDNLFSYTNETIKNNSSTATLSNVISSYLPTRRQDVLTTNITLEGVAIFTWGTQIVIRITGITSAADLQSYLTSHPLYVIYELATPTTPTITPTEFNTLVSAFGLQGWLVQIEMPAAEGYVYGALIDILNGKLWVTYKAIDMGDISWDRYKFAGSDFYVFYANIQQRISASPVMCESYKLVQTIPQGLNNYEIESNSNATYIYVRNDDYETVSAFTTAVTGQKLIYQLANPIEYNLTPQQINSLLGTNNIFADCGPVNVRYFVQSTQPMIDYIDDKTENVVKVFKATDEGGGVYTLDDVTCDELCTYARDHSNIVLKVARYNSAISYDIFILSDYIGTSAVFRHTMITSAIGGGSLLYVRELQADSGNATKVLTTRDINISANS